MCSTHDEAMMQLALESAQQAADQGEIPVGAVAFRIDQNNQAEVLAVTHNQREVSYDPSAHAEILALRQASQKLKRWRLDDVQLAVTLEPCAMCAGAIIAARLKRCVWGAHDPKAGCCCSIHHLLNDRHFNHNTLWRGLVLAQPCGQILRDFFEQKR